LMEVIHCQGESVVSLERTCTRKVLPVFVDLKR